MGQTCPVKTTTVTSASSFTFMGSFMYGKEKLSVMQAAPVRWPRLLLKKPRKKGKGGKWAPHRQITGFSPASILHWLSASLLLLYHLSLPLFHSMATIHSCRLSLLWLRALGALFFFSLSLRQSLATVVTGQIALSLFPLVPQSGEWQDVMAVSLNMFSLW